MNNLLFIFLIFTVSFYLTILFSIAFKPYDTDVLIPRVCYKVYVIDHFQLHKKKTAHPSRPSGRKGIAKRRETLKNRKEYAYADVTISVTCL